MKYDPDRYYVRCANGCGCLVGRGTPKHTCWQCRMEDAIEPIPMPPQWHRKYWEKKRKVALAKVTSERST